MKVLIWLLCFFVNALVTTIIKDSGIILGGIPTAILYGLTIWLASTLCKKWDEHKESKTPKSPTNACPKVEETTDNKIQYCRKCGEKLAENSRFCSKCGTEIIRG